RSVRVWNYVDWEDCEDWGDRGDWVDCCRDLRRALRIMRSSNSGNLIPAALAASGSRLVAVIPGVVLTSRTTISTPRVIMSTRDIPSHPSAWWPRRASAAACWATCGESRAGTLRSLQPVGHL